MSALELTRLGRRYGQSFVIRDINLSLSTGKVLVLKGANGAGKTTLLKVLASRLRPSQGRAKVFGFDLVKQAHEVRKNVAYLSVLGGMYPNLTAFENLKLAGSLYGHVFTAAELGGKLEAVGLLDASHKLVRSFSSGMKKRLALAKLILADADLWLLDEPYAALDEEGKTLVDTILKLASQEGRTVVMASHDLTRSRPFADAVLSLEGGHLKQEAPEVVSG